ncbi:MAG: sensor histidine kinase KdpD [Pseudomonadota bacterium]|nr:sensor histidine kinase KdpD [Pseudomonadota bacterium]
MGDTDRRDPDELLTEIKRNDALDRCGRLKIFFGASAGVGKTYSMIESARSARAAGVDIVVGYVEPHGRAETERLLEGLEQLAFLQVRYRNITRREFDLDAALLRAPTILLVDELAHSNLIEGEPKPRHAKRWQDIEELLAAGINVWTTVNVQHLESLNDVVASITGIRQHETVPDRIFDEADEVELIDLSPKDLLARLKAGKVYLSEQVTTATERYFKEPNLLALREMALRRTADRVDAAARAYSGRERASKPWLARDRFLVAVTPDDQAEQLVRVGKRFADALDAEWFVVSVETPNMLKLGEQARNRRINVLRLAESLGAQTVTLDGPSASAALTEYARVRNVTRIVVGEPKRFGLRALLRPSTATKLVRTGAGFDVSVIARRGPSGNEPPRRELDGPVEIRWNRYWAAVAISLACTALAAVMYPYFALTNLVMVYLLGATIAALRLGRGPASLAAVVNIIAFDFCFVPPRFTLAVADFQYVVTFAVMLTVALIIANLVANVRAQTRVSGARERRTALLYGMSRELAATRSVEDLARVAVKHVAETFASLAVILVPDSNGRLHHPRSTPITGSLLSCDLSVAQWVFDHTAPAGLGTDTLPAALAQYLPLKGSGNTLGVLAIEPTHRRRLLLPEQRHLAETFAAQIALALERADLAEEAEVSRITAETEGLRNTLLASISHDLRTPLAVIAGASSALNDVSLVFEPETRARLTASIESKAHEMSEIISNVLDLMRFETGQVALRRDWQTIDDLVGSALTRVEPRLVDHPVEVNLPAELPAVYVDAPFVAQVFSNLLENAAKHTPAGTRIVISADNDAEFVRVSVDDFGPGLPAGDPELLFAKFQRGRHESNTGGAGLGLAICRAIVNAHGGRISAMQRTDGGARFVFTLPTTEPTP